MKSYGLTPAAEDDLFEIWAYIAADSFEAAWRTARHRRNENEVKGILGRGMGQRNGGKGKGMGCRFRLFGFIPLPPFLCQIRWRFRHPRG